MLRTITLLFILLVIFLFPLTSLANGLVPPCGGDGQPPCTLCHLFQMFKNIVDFVLFSIVPPVAVLMLVIGGFMFFFAGGNPGNLSRAKSIITSVVIGLIIVYTAWLIVNTFFAVIGVADWTGLRGGWFKIECTFL